MPGLVITYLGFEGSGSTFWRKRAMFTLNRWASSRYAGPQTLVSRSSWVTTRPALRARYARILYSVGVRLIASPFRSAWCCEKSTVRSPVVNDGVVASLVY